MSHQIGTKPEPKLLTPSEAAALLGVTSDRVRGLANLGRLPCIRTAGGHRRYDVAEVLALAAQRNARQKK